MRLQLVFVGKTNLPEIEKSVQGYLERLRHYTPLEVHYVKGEKITRKSADHLVREKESERILNLVGDKGTLIVWDERGKQLDSVSFAHWLERLRNRRVSNVWMVVGGPLGISSKLRERAHAVFALSKMTFPHDLARLLVVEQLYRAFSILKGEPYHK
jgi:23S rRNA (pseudouridine1915-N3)-methyltransferase